MDILKSIGLALILTIVALLLYTFGISLRGDQAPNDDMQEENTPQEEQVLLYFYNSENDTDEKGNVLCSKEGLVSVVRTIETQDTPEEEIFKAVTLLLRGATNEEIADEGIESEFPLNALTLQGVVFEDGVVTLSFNDPLNETSGGSCRAGVLWFQIEETALQFEGVREVQFSPETLFQP